MEHSQVIEHEVGLRKIAVLHAVERSPVTVKRLHVELMIATSFEQARGALHPPDSVRTKTFGIVPDLANMNAQGAMPFPSGAGKLARGPLAKLDLDSLVGVDRDEPVGIVSPGGLDETAVIHRVVPSVRIGRGDADQLKNFVLARNECGRSVGRAVVEGNDSIDLRSHILEPVGEEAHLVAKHEQRENAR
jgi:hypothetical protein